MVLRVGVDLMITVDVVGPVDVFLESIVGIDSYTQHWTWGLPNWSQRCAANDKVDDHFLHCHYR